MSNHPENPDSSSTKAPAPRVGAYLNTGKRKGNEHGESN